MTPEAPAFEHEQDDRRLALLHRRSLLRIVFDFRDGLWRHSLGVATQARHPWLDQMGLAAFLASVEAQPDAPPDSPPPSPSYQELHYDPEQKPQQVLLVGKFGPHHYSAVFSVREESDPDTGAEALVFDVDIADRCRTPAALLSAVYTAQPVASLAEMQENALSFLVAATDREFFRLKTQPPAAIQARPQGPGGGVLVQLVTTPDPAAGTHRLRYFIRCPIH